MDRKYKNVGEKHKKSYKNIRASLTSVTSPIYADHYQTPHNQVWENVREIIPHTTHTHTTVNLQDTGTEKAEIINTENAV